MKFLIADDDGSSRLLLRTILEAEGDTVKEAVNGFSAVKTYKDLAKKPDVVILDVHMPIMDGLGAARAIRKLQIENDTTDYYLPILFVTGSDNEKILSECFEIGDEVLSKPTSSSMAQAKIKSIKRHLNQFRELRKKQKELQALNKIHQEEFSLARNIFKHFTQMNDTSSGNFRYHSSPSTTFNGDLVLCARSPMDTLYVFVGDLTGHGLPAAIAATPINKIFFTMAKKGVSVCKIAQELNHNLFNLLPDNIFCAAFILEMSNDGKQVRVWSGGMPSLIITHADGSFKETIPCSHMPLGSESPETFESNIQTLLLRENERLYLFTDGITESQNDAGELFGEERLYQLLSKRQKNHLNKFDHILEQVGEFSSETQHDDTTLTEIISQALDWPIKETGEAPKSAPTKKPSALKHALDWQFRMKLSGKDFQRGDPASQIIQFLNNTIGIDVHQDTLSTVLTELYSNALEHGLMKLSSSLKDKEDGFIDYYLKRSERLGILEEDDSIDIVIHFTPSDVSPHIQISITDSGDGFDSNKVKSVPINLEDEFLHGRGQQLIGTLCHELGYSNGGRTATATYDLLQAH